ncbi:hypothetical protein DGWBC_1718 [Dehalogenimonas sp. WBC-2]|nr:hypothetical protein DGWBC_1718 [Dehalogenimonas sp. WBC-2]
MTPQQNTRPEEPVTQLLDPNLNTLSQKHADLFRRYQMARVVVDFGAAACFVSGSVLFLNPNNPSAAAGLFLAGSLLFAVKPTIDLIRGFHLSKIASHKRR